MKRPRSPFLSTLLLPLLALTAAPSATAQALQFGGGIALGLNSTCGWRFTADEDVYVTSVGLWDRQGNGFAASHELRIWTSNGATELLATQIPSGTAASPAGPSQGQGRFRYIEVPELLLRAGNQYVIGAYAAGDDFVLGGANVSTAPGVTWNGGLFSSGFTFPTGSLTSGGIGPNFLFRPAIARPAVEIDVSPSPQILNFNATRGWRFRAEQDVVVTSVGMWDRGSDGLQSSHDLAIWTADGSSQLLLTQIPAGASAPLMGPEQGPGRFRYHGVPPLTLMAGQEYVIGMQVGGDDFLNDGVNAITSSAEISWLEGRFTSSGFAFPTSSVPGNKYFGPNFLYERPVERVGAGCVDGFASYYEVLSPAAMDLSGQELLLHDYGGGFRVSTRPGTIQPIGSIGTPVAGPTGDDSAMVMGTLAMEIHSNCQVAFAAGNSTGYVPTVDTMLNTNPATALYAWTDLDPSAPAGGSIWYEESGADYQVTYDGVFKYGTTDPVTVQFRGNRLSNTHVISFGATHGSGQDWLIGYSPGGPNRDPGPIDYTAFAAAAPYVSREPDTYALELEAVNSPFLGGPVVVRTSNFEPGAVFHVGIVGISDPATSLAFLGLDPSCELRASLDVLVGPAIVAGQSSVNWVPIDLTTGSIGFEFYVQAATIDLSALSGTTRLSNGLRMRTY
ncbi:MAG: hypothetical protein KAI24_09750 [Planctomycetes bacterium]|nr:hypothetical protein [Planctomycetota bacterium]